VRAYEIHHGVAELTNEADAFLDGCQVGQVWGTMWHGALENDGFRRAWLAEIAAASGSLWRPQADAPSFAARREAMINKLADAIEDNADLELILGSAR
jgi:adenosylcobyric acid synthase